MQRVQDTFAGHGADVVSTGGLGHEAGRSPSQISNVDLLRYVSDMVEELQHMSDRTGCTTLVGLLSLARAEAAVQLRVRRAG
jgi:hypothetical protein